MNAIQKTDFSKVCRTCLLKINKMSPIFTQNIIDMLTVCTNIRISKYDGLPEQICGKCVESIKVSYNFKLQSEKCDKYLHQFIENEKGDDFTSITIKLEDSFPRAVSEDDSVTKDADVANDSLKPNQYLNSRNEQNSHEDFSSIIIKTEGSCTGDNSESDLSNKNSDDAIKSKYSLDRKEECSDKSFPRKRKKKVVKKSFSLKRKNENKKVSVQNKGTKKYECEHCDSIFFELNSLANHLKAQHDVKFVECEICKKEFVLKLQLEYHMRVHGKKRFFCKFCGKEVNSGTTLKSHELSHTEEDPHPCPHCRKLFKHRPSLRWHIMRAHRGERIKDICTICGVEVFHLKHHMLRKHPTDRPFKCDECNQSFGVEWAYKEHKKRHTAEYKEPKKLCTVCGKKSHTATALVYHMRTHTGESPFTCPICGKTTKTNSAMIAHKRTHTGERPYECPTCHRKFTTSYCAKKHQLIHTGERPYECNMCGRPFRQKSALKTHMKIH